MRTASALQSKLRINYLLEIRETEMNTTTKTKSANELTLTESVVALLQHYLGGRKGLILLTVVALSAGMYFNWGWLVAAGVAPILLAVAPCALMCGLGLCVNKMCGKSNPTQSKSVDQDSSTSLSSTTPDGKTTEKK